MKKALSVTVPVIANEITDARIGPTHGVHNRPRDNPTITPPTKPLFVSVLGAKPVSLENNCSRITWNLGINKTAPKPPTMNTDTSLNVSAGISIKRIIVVKKSVKKVKLATNPRTTPSGLILSFWLFPKLEERTIGSIGKIHGDKIVTIPAMKAKRINKITLDSQAVWKGRLRSIWQPRFLPGLSGRRYAGRQSRISLPDPFLPGPYRCHYSLLL